MDDIEKIRQNLWCSIAVAYVSSINSGYKSEAAKWAEKVLEDFDERFKNVKSN